MSSQNDDEHEGLLAALASLAADAAANDPAGRYIEATDHPHLFSPRTFPEHTVDLGEIRMNYAVVGDPACQPLLLIPGQTESWWGYEDAMRLLAADYHVFAVDLRGQGRSTWTPGRYSLDALGNDLVRFIDLAMHPDRPVIVAGLSSGAVVTAWLAAYAKPGQLAAAILEDPPLFASELAPAFGNGIRQTIAGPMFKAWNMWLGPQWTVGNEAGLEAARARDMPAWIPTAVAALLANAGPDAAATAPPPLGPPLRLAEYDPEWGEAFWTGRMSLTCNHATMLRHVKVPVLLTHHFRHVDPVSGNLLGALSDVQAAAVRRLVEAAGRTCAYRSFPRMSHSMHGADPICYVSTVTEWLESMNLGKALHPTTDQLPAKSAAAAAADDDSNEPVRPNAAAPPTVKVDGTWNLTVQTPMGAQPVTLTLAVGDGNSLTGALNGAEGRNEISNGTIDGATVYFHAAFKRGVKLSVSYKATIDGDSISGTAKARLLPAIRFTGTRAA
ncbi:hypothetical protein HK405_012422 [Cladochytrium tenue]|nr:hypothetical protein HK405_012422 [Cladochytrium tenue]